MANLIIFAAEQKSSGGGGNFLGATVDTDRYRMRRKSDCGLQQIQQFQQQHSRGHFDHPQSRQRNKRNRSLDRSNEHLDSMQLPQRNAGLGGSHYGLNRSMANHFSSSTTHLNIQLGPLQLPPHPHFSGECKVFRAFDELIVKVHFSFLPADAHCGELKLGFFLSDDYLEVEIVSGRELPNANTGRPGKVFLVFSLHFAPVFLLKRLIDSWIDEQYLLKCCSTTINFRYIRDDATGGRGTVFFNPPFGNGTATDQSAVPTHCQILGI